MMFVTHLGSSLGTVGKALEKALGPSVPALAALAALASVGASVGVAVALTFRMRISKTQTLDGETEEAEEAKAEADEASRVWLESSWPRWGLPRKLFAGLWLLVMYPILAYVMMSLVSLTSDKLLWAAAALHLVSNSIWVPSFVRWQSATLAVVSALLMVLSAAWIAIRFAHALPVRTRVMLWVYVAWVAYSASITSNFLFADD